MGLDTTHDCFHGAYSAFHRLRLEVLKYAVAPREVVSTETSFYEVPADLPLPLQDFLLHSDCDGTIEVKDQIAMAECLEVIADKMEAAADPDDTGWGHIKAYGGFLAGVRKFARGLRRANELGEPVGFH